MSSIRIYNDCPFFLASETSEKISFINMTTISGPDKNNETVHITPPAPNEEDITVFSSSPPGPFVRHLFGRFLVSICRDSKLLSVMLVS